MLKINAKKFLEILKPVKFLLPNDTLCALKQVGNFLIFNVIEPSFYFSAKVDVLDGELGEGVFVTKTDNLFKLLRLFDDVKIKETDGSLVFSQNRRKYSLKLEESENSFFCYEIPAHKKKAILENKKIAVALQHIFIDEKEGNYGPDKYIWIKDGFMYSSYKPVVIHSVVKIPTETDSSVFDDKFLTIYGNYAKLISQVKENFDVFDSFEDDNLIYHFYNNNYYLRVSGIRQFEDSDYLESINDFTSKYEESEQFISFEPFNVKYGVNNIGNYFKDANEYGINIRKKDEKLWIVNPSQSDGYGHEEYVVNDYSKIDEISMNVDKETFSKVLSCCGDDIGEWRVLIKEDDDGKFCYNFIKTDNILQGFGSYII